MFVLLLQYVGDGGEVVGVELDVRRPPSGDEE